MDEKCGECGHALELSKGPGRYRSYRGGSGFEIPPDLEFPTCPSCGAEWMTGDQVNALSDAFEAERRRRQTPGGLMMTRIEIKLLAQLLSMAQEEFGNHGCNDFSLTRDGGLTPGEAEEFVSLAQASSPGEEEVFDGGDIQFDSTLYSYFKQRVARLL